MRLFRRRPSRDDLYERLIAEKDAQIVRLIALLEGRPVPLAQLMPPPPVAEGQTGELGSPTWESEEDEAQAILDKEGLSKVHLAEILDGLGVGSSDLS